MSISPWCTTRTDVTPASWSGVRASAVASGYGASVPPMVRKTVVAVAPAGTVMASMS